MRIGVLIDRLNIGGVEKASIQQVRSLQKLGVDATLLVLSRKSIVEGAHRDLLEEIKVEYLDDRLPSLFRFTFGFPMFAFFSFFHISYPFLIPFVIKSDEYDYILSHSSYTSFTAVTIRKFRRIPYSIYFWDPVNFILNRVYKGKIPNLLISMFTVFAKVLDKMLATNADVVFSAGDTFIDYFVETCGCTREKVVVVNPGTTLGKPTKNKGNHVLMVTTWKKGKHPEYVFEIIKFFPKVKIKMVGGWLDDQMLVSFKKGLKENGFEKNVEILGEANEQQLAEYYPKSPVHLTTNLERGFGMPTLEAAACGTTFIVPLGSGVCSVFEDGIDGFFIKEHDTKEIVAKIKLLMGDKELAIKMGMNAYKTAKKDHTWEAHTQKILSAIPKN